MFGAGGDRRQMSFDIDPLSVDSNALIVTYPKPNFVGGNSPFPMEDVQQYSHGSNVELVVSHSKKLEDDLQQLGEKIKHQEENVNYLKTLRSKLEDSIFDIQVSIGKHHPTLYKEENGKASCGESDEETTQHIMKYENSAAALLCKIKSEVQFSDDLLIKDVVGVVATLGKVDDANLSRILSEYLGLQTMLAVVCKSYEGVKNLETYTKDGLINKGSGIHAFAASKGRHLDDRFHVICLENLRPYAGALIADDPQRRLNLLKPRLINGETPPGFLGFAVNMIKIDNSYLHPIFKSGHSLRETLFYNLFLNLQVYKSREEMQNARSSITTGAISLDGGLIKSPGIFTLGHYRGDIDVKFPCDPKKFVKSANDSELQNRLKEMKWKKDRALEDMQREQDLLDQAKFKYEIKKRELVRFIAESSSLMTQVSGGMCINP
ncbi:protein DEFECTIVE IN MERISTEM SILENCING 3-like isoform X1 [Salvia splendens]|uniref:protein DEFECTIVE IN MERISTEM SILENCING 3-like isoform X1 n=2 Tax=Salvia splendens TaxID=180675 RepID=UPI001C277F38|nr:protein DEFECTIVE IN MERISTEM SILENCING 3-like isoform X1 [Salvia splendens]